MRYLTAILMALFTSAVLAQSSARAPGPVDNFNITGFPLYGRLVTPDDSNDLPIPGYVRADAEGSVKVACYGNAGSPITLEMLAGEFVPCLVGRVYQTDTEVTVHLFY